MIVGYSAQYDDYDDTPKIHNDVQSKEDLMKILKFAAAIQAKLITIFPRSCSFFKHWFLTFQAEKVNQTKITRNIFFDFPMGYV